MLRNEIEALAREIAASEGISLAQAWEIAKREYGAVLAYAQAWDYMVGASSPAQVYNGARTA